MIIIGVGPFQSRNYFTFFIFLLRLLKKMFELEGVMLDEILRIKIIYYLSNKNCEIIENL